MKRFTWLAIGVTFLGCAGLLYTYTRTPTDTPRQNSQGAPVLQTVPQSPAAAPTPASTRPRRRSTANTGNPHSDEVDTLEAFQQTEFYQTIVENNIFLPLGATAPKPAARYRLIATTTTASGDIGSTALLQSNAGDTEARLFVTIGDKLGDATVVEIQPKQVTIETDGKQTTLELEEHLWLRSSR